MSRLARRLGVRLLGVTCAAAVALATGVASQAAAQGRDQPADTPVPHWVAAWTASMQGASALGATHLLDVLDGTNQLSLLQKYVAPPQSFTNETLRQIMYIHHSGSAIRIELSNQYGSVPARFQDVTVGVRSGDGADIVAGTLHDVTFGGGRSVTVPVGQTVMSDPVALPVAAFDSVVVSMYVPAGDGAATAHGNAMQTFYTAPGDVASAESSAGFAEHGFISQPGTDFPTHLLGNWTTAEYYVSQIDVAAQPSACTLVAYGDSITDGYMSTVNTNSRYPDYLASRLQANPATRYLSVVNEAISGDRVTADGIGPSALSRLQRDVLSLPNVCGVIMLEGINDMGTALLQGAPVPANQLEAGYESIAATLKSHGIPLFLGTLEPSGDVLHAVDSIYGLYPTPGVAAERAAVNDWIRNSAPQITAGVVDFYRTTVSATDPNVFSPQYDSGDSLHPNDTGYAAMADAVPLNLLTSLAAR